MIIITSNGIIVLIFTKNVEQCYEVRDIVCYCSHNLSLNFKLISFRVYRLGLLSIFWDCLGQSNAQWHQGSSAFWQTSNWWWRYGQLSSVTPLFIPLEASSIMEHRVSREIIFALSSSSFTKSWNACSSTTLKGRVLGPHKSQALVISHKLCQWTSETQSWRSPMWSA